MINLRPIKKSTILTALLLSALCLSLITGLQDLAYKFSCGTASCEKVHLSSFGSIFGIPLGLWASPALLVAFLCHSKQKRGAVAFVLAAMLGAEIYFTFIQVYFIGSLCFSCICFLALLGLCAALTLDRSRLPKAGIFSCLSFFCLHFFFFFPALEPKATLARFPADSRVEVFGSPACNHCKEAISELKNICSLYNADLIVRPVALSARDYDQTLTWVCSMLFDKETECAKKLAEKVLWQNEDTLRQLVPGNVSLPIIAVTTPQGTKLLKGWQEQFGDVVYQLLEANALSSLGIGDVLGSVCAPTTCH